MNRLLKKLAWVYDYYFVYFLYNEKKIDRYHGYMKNKWGYEQSKKS